MSDTAHEFATLVRQLRVALGRHARGGAWATSAAATVRHHNDAAAAPAAPTELVAATIGKVGLQTIRDELGDCQRCGLCTTRNKIVFGSGAEHAPLMFVGEGPGADEDRTGEPFVGAAGELLDKMIVAMGWQRSAVYIANVVKCRPPQNRTPADEEVAACAPFLTAQIGSVMPRIIVALGRPAANFILGKDAPISSLRGQFFDCTIAGHATRVMPTFHPAYLLRTPEKKREAWADLQLVMAELARLGISPGGAR